MFEVSSPEGPRLKVVSGGQTGVDQGALEAAIELGLDHGGWCPRGRLSEAGPIPTRFQLSEMYYDRYWYDSNFGAVEELRKIAEKAGKNPISLAFQWLAAQDTVDSIIVGISKMSHLEENLSAWEGELDDDTLAACDEVWNSIRGVSFKYNR